MSQGKGQFCWGGGISQPIANIGNIRHVALSQCNSVAGGYGLSLSVL